MSDLGDGDIIRPTPPTVADTQELSYTCTNSTFDVTASSTYEDCGVAFVACETGQASIEFAADLDNSSTAASTDVAPVVREGPVIGAGAQVQGADLSTGIRNVGDENRRFGSYLLVSGLTPWRTYNVRLEHRVSASTGTIKYRHLVVAPET
jgi:hypothetical protein